MYIYVYMSNSLRKLLRTQSISPLHLDCLKIKTVYHVDILLPTSKVKCSRYRPGVAQRVGIGIAVLFHDRGTRRMWVVSSTPRPHLPPGKTRYPFYMRLDGPQGRSGRAENLVPTGIRSRTVQPEISRYTDWATRPTLSTSRLWKISYTNYKNI